MASNTASTALYTRPCSCFSDDRKRDAIMGVSVRDTMADTAMVMDTVTANSRNSRPTMPPISSSGMNTATSDRLIDSTVKPTSRAPRIAASNRGMPSSM